MKLKDLPYKLLLHLLQNSKSEKIKQLVGKAIKEQDDQHVKLNTDGSL